MKHVLVVDDNKVSLAAAKKVLGSSYRVTAVTSGAQTLRFLENNSCDVILLDINMPEMDGFQTMERIRTEVKNPPPIIFLTADNDEYTESCCLKAGALDFVTKPFSEPVMLSRVNRVIKLSEMKNGLEAMLKERMQHIRHIQEMMVLGLATMVESRDNSTGGHIKRTSDVVKIFSQRLLGAVPDLSADFLDMVTRAAPMHDLGKIAVDDVILRKQGRFTDEEYAAMKKHSAEGARIVEQILNGVEEEAFVKIAVNIAHYHHEKWNGSGYPTGISGEDIPLEARIMALADVFDALVSKRCYKEAYSYDRAFDIIESSLGSHFDPELGRVFMTCRPELEKLYNNS